MRVEPVFKGHAWVGLLIFLSILLDGAVATSFSQWLMTDNFTGTPELTLITLVMVTIWLPEERFIVAFSTIAGLIFDSFYTGILGINVLIWPLAIYLIETLAPSLPRSAFFVFAMTMLVIAVALFVGFFFMQVAGLADERLIDLIGHHLGPTLVTNLILFIVAYLPIRQILLKLEP